MAQAVVVVLTPDEEVILRPGLREGGSPAESQPARNASTERHRSRTCLASGYDAVLVLKTSWGTSPGRSAGELICLSSPDSVCTWGFAAHFDATHEDHVRPLRSESEGGSSFGSKTAHCVP